MSVTLDCTENCERVVTCTVCKRRKPPIGRDVAAEMSGGYCEHECPGHDQEPRGGHLWPGELTRSREPWNSGHSEAEGEGDRSAEDNRITQRECLDTHHQRTNGCSIPDCPFYTPITGTVHST